MKHVYALAVVLVACLWITGCGKAEIVNPFTGEPAGEQSTELEVSPSGADIMSGKSNSVEFASLGSDPASRDLSYTAAETRTLQVLVYSTATNFDCDLGNIQTFAEWTPEGGSATRVKTGDSFTAGDSYTVEAGKKYNFRFIVHPASGCTFASFQYKVL